VIAGEGRPPSGPVLDNATRLQMQAQAGAVLVSPAIARLAGGFLKLESRGPRAFQVFGESTVHTRFELSRARGLTRFVGRSDVFDLLNDALERSAHGSGQVVGVMAEAGAGKSRLCFEFTEQCRARGLEVFSASATQQQQNTPLFAVLAMLRSFFGVEDLDDDATARGKIEARALHLDAKLATSLPVIFDLLSVADPDRPSSPIDPDGRRRQLVSLTRHVIGLASASHPTVTLIEDLHWLDDASAAFLEQLANARDGLNNLLIVNYRPEFRASWLQNSHCRQISLAPLGDDAVASLLDDLLGRDPSVAALAAPIAAQTKGNPYFVEEVVQTLVETGKIEGHRGAYRLVSALEKLEVPATVKAVVSARIDRLPNRERNLLQVAAVIGDSFSETLLAAASGLAMADLEAAVSALRRTEFIVERAVFPVVEHAFKHPLTLEMALASLLKARRRELHADVARAIEAEAGDDSASRAAMLAYHWDEAGERLIAAQWRLMAGHRTSRTDFFAAARHWRRVLDLCEGLDDPMATLMFVDAASQLLTAGYRLGMDLDEAKALLARAEAVIGPDGSPLFRLILSVCYSRALCVDGDVGAYRALSRENHVEAMASGDFRLQVIAKFRLCDSLTHSGSHLECLAEAEAGMAFCPLDQPGPDWLPDYHPHLFFGFMRGVALTWLGRLAEAERQLLDVIDLAKTDGSIEVVAWCSLQLSIAYSLLGDCGRSLEAATTVATISERLGSPLLIAYRHISFIRAYSCAGSFEKALPEATAAIELFGHVEQHWAALGKMHLAHCLLELGRTPEALATAELAVEGFRTCNITHNEVEALGLLVRARLRVEGAAAAVAVERLLGKAEEIIDAEAMETLRPFLHEWRAELAQTRGDEAASARLLERAAEGHAANGAERQAARVRNQGLKVLS
jgi:adenylate cyclase